jgi:hypothetical protein
VILRTTIELCVALAMGACTSGSDPNASRPCTGVCAGPWLGCQETYATNDCLEKVCCVLPSDGGPPYLGDGGSCPGLCASPDDIGCPGTWYRTNVCALNDLCCGGPLDGGTD